MKKLLLGTALTCGLLSNIGLAHGADPTLQDTAPAADEVVTYPYLEGEFIWELQNDYTYDSDDPDAELNDTFAYLELAVSLILNETFQINTAIIAEPVQDPGPGDDRFFDDHGVFVEVLEVQVNFSEDTNVVAGKIGPGFGTAWDITPGIYGVDFAEDYELSEFIGFGLNHTFDGAAFGAVTFGASVFFADTTFLSDSIITRRGQTDITDGGAGNTEDLDNFAISLDGEELPDLPGFAWHLAYRHLSAGQGDLFDEEGIAAGFVQEVDLGEELSATFNFEYATFNNFGGGADDVDYVTAGLTVANGPWHLDVAGTLRDTDVVGGPDIDDALFQASVGYVDQNDIDWNVGYLFTEDGGVDNHTLGIFITKAIEFSTQ
ncbi:MAG: hypothetical protein AAGA53_04785 [Pseudomonadota bacterium]